MRTIRNMIQITDSEKFISEDILKIAEKSKRSQYSGYDNTRMAGQIRKLLMEQPDAGHKEVEALCGPLTRSVRVTYYRIYQELLKNLLLMVMEFVMLFLYKVVHIIVLDVKILVHGNSKKMY